ncbi:hypothetical protein BDV35DRAFT_395739 [Aspergillus flavus]|uniref:Unnamed protein product n=3 Tax=Aspergillus subgen. Circumdati TaxID=2720871 RepID=A0A1S9D7E3_ASPOZ|nr:hypothetical protein BDV35DRAFT_395739 [Aspergillus flavus]OOO04949.1 hypothetical protein OAory_01112860 [Aspergillus oryzae]GMG48198.1 unnamed protein product [Aspergillus oryzae var. brunneus]GMF78041.1 unnamed protein product [Aspergillus oryzae]GMF91978.1 unnamed protein product [Aspergillus oryzae]
MTTRNLNKTWRDIIFDQYSADLSANEPFPIRYLINAPEWKKDIFINVPKKISLEAYRSSVLAFCRTKYRDSDPIYEDENLSVRPRVSRHQAQAEEIDKYQHDLETKDNPTGFGVFYDRS